jgi:hypothetical protein
MDMNVYTADSGKKYTLPRVDMTKEENDKWQARKQAWANLRERAKQPPIFPLPENDPDYKKLREIIYRERGLIN